MVNGKEFAVAKINGKKVVVFSKTFCPFCRMAKAILDKYRLSQDDYEVIEIEKRNDVAAIQDYMLELTGARTVPRVFIGGKCIGGGQETTALEDSGQLREILQAAGAIAN
ncbi:PREDICTED: glutaredoxin-1-like [Priapulus caudatus]|uniref:Glutaredoxin-1 n=1 Tax=Priapulus caudatus TaxID=37621 RepID=A0ABM1F3T1_PRICU|nr:PREDICTED: glutaredoxin-1-like [Priapulus caudatus]